MRHGYFVLEILQRIDLMEVTNQMKRKTQMVKVAGLPDVHVIDEPWWPTKTLEIKT